MLKLSRDNPTLQLKAAIGKICGPFLNQHGLSYFQYLRCFPDGLFSLLTNHTGCFEEFSQMKNTPLIYSSFTSEHEQNHAYWFLWDEELPDFPVNYVREKHGLHHGLTLVRRSKNYYDMIAVALPHAKRNIGSYYLSKQKAIETFINEFEMNNRELIDKTSKIPIILPEPCRDRNYHKICLSSGNITLLGAEGYFQLTTQELSCIKLLKQGLSYKEIGKQLSISWRTVETYLSRAKQKSRTTSRKALIRLLDTCP